MKHLIVADKALLVGDEVADLLVEYAKLLGQQRSADSVEVAAIGPDGSDVVATLLLNGGTSFVAETTSSSTPEPGNGSAEVYLRSRIDELRGQGPFSAERIASREIWNEGVVE